MTPGGRRRDPRAVLGQVLAITGVLVLVILTWVRLLDEDRTGLPVVLAGVVGILAIGAAVFALGVRRSQARHEAVAAQRPGWRLHEVWADAGLGAQLVREGLWERGVAPTGGTRLTLAWSADGVELWRAGHVVVALPWHDVASLGKGVGHAGSTARPALVINTLGGAELVLVPQARPSGGVLPADRAGVAALLDELRETRDQRERG